MKSLAFPANYPQVSLKSTTSRLSLLKRYGSQTGTRLFFALVLSLMVLYLIAPDPSSRASGVDPKAYQATRSDLDTPPALATLKWLAPSRINYFSAPLPQSSSMVSTLAGDCTTSKTLFNVQDSDKTVCARITGAQPGWQVIWSNANFVAVQTTMLTASNQDVTFTLTTSSNLGDWRVILFEPFGGTVQALTSFTVIDADNPVADVGVNKGGLTNEAAAGSQAVFNIIVTNGGPSVATNVELTDAVPAGTSFVSFVQLSGPVFTCTNPNAGSTGTTTCSIASLMKDDAAVFLATYEVDGGASRDTVVVNSAGITSGTPDNNDKNQTSSAEIVVRPTPCVLTCADNISVSADSGQAGAVVSYNAPGTAGDCGQPTTGESGEVIPAVSCSPASGSFFPVGTSSVICTSQTGGLCTFQVTVNNPGGLSISLNGASPFNLECGEEFNDPGATAVNGSGQSIEVGVTGTVDSHTAGSYTLTYTATETPNSVSTTRTVVVADDKAPTITIDGPNPMTTSCGQPFVDPGVSATDSCEGSKPVNSSGTVNTNIPGTYTITYTASDSHNHTATATRSVIVESGANAPPTISLNGSPQIEIECGTPFVDPGATAVVPCGGSVPVTVSGTVDIHTPATYTLTYTACVESTPGHCDPALTTQVERTVEVTADATAPTITLNGPNPLTVECHGVFTDPGATAHDACAGDFAATASGVVNTNVVGQYTITYNATDPSGHAASPVTRTVNVVDTTPPTITTCAAPQSVNVAGSCQAQVPDFTSGVVASDVCSGVTITQSPAAGAVVGIGITTVTLTATDTLGNHSSCTTTFTVNGPQVTALGSSQIWVGVKNSDDVGTKFDFLAEVFANGTLVGSGQLNDVSGGSSGFNNAIQSTVNMALSGPANTCTGSVLSIRLSVRVAASSGHVSGTARLWFNDSAANSRFTATVGGSATTFYLQDGFVLATTPGPGPKKTIDVLVNRNVGGNPFRPFGTWNVTL